MYGLPSLCKRRSKRVALSEGQGGRNPQYLGRLPRADGVLWGTKGLRMANPEHVEIVKKGAEETARWHKAHSRENLNLSDVQLPRADLSYCKLRGTDLIRANLRDVSLVCTELLGADLRHANLHGADVNSADLSGADLSRANLSGADLSYANLHAAELSYANLNGASLLGSNLNRANLKGADLTGSDVGETVFADVDLSQVRGLDEVRHSLACSIGIDTLVKSKGKIPKSFLKGCGVPDVWIEYLPTLIGAMEPIQFYSCFLSYSSRDDAFARRLHGRLEQEKLRVWFAPEDMEGGRRFAGQIDEAIRVYDRLLLVLSEHSMDSEWVRREIKRARKKEKEIGREVLFPIRLVDFGAIGKWECLDSDSGEDLAEKVREFQIPDFSKWKEEDEFETGFASLMRDLRREDAGEARQTGP